MKSIYAGVFIFLIATLCLCAIIACRSKRSAGKAVAFLLSMLIFPVAGNLLLVLADNLKQALGGCYLYSLGIILSAFALLRFTLAYCESPPEKRKFAWIAYILLILDAISLLLNIFTHHAFTLGGVTVDGQMYFRIAPLFGQYVHRVIVYGTVVSVVIVFIVKIVTTSKIYLEKYAVILAAMAVLGCWQAYHLISQTPIDRSMIGYGIFGLLVFYFTIFYRPIRLLDRLLINMVSELPEALLFFDQNLECIWANEKSFEIFGITKKELPQMRDRLIALFGKPAKPGGEWTEQKAVQIDGETVNYLIRKQNMRDEKGRIYGVFMSIRDNTEEIKALEVERYNAEHDSVTGLLNKEYLYRKAEEILAANPDKTYVISIAGIDDFEAVQDVYGTGFVDEALKQITKWISWGLSDDSVTGRIGDSEFGCLMPFVTSDMTHLEKNISHQVIRAGDVEQHIFMHFGLYVVKTRDVEVSVMFDRAKIALAKVRDSMTNYVGFYDEEMRDDRLWNQMISGELPAALENKDIVPYLQPIMDADGKLKGAEVLARWNHPKEGFLSPVDFIPVFEKNGLIAEIDRYMWRCACELLAEWQKEGRDLFLSVNISPRDFEVLDIIGEIKGLVEEFGIDQKKLRLEITETAMGINQKKRLQMLRDLQNEGFFIEMDDFGSGYSSMNLLKDMPLDLLKLDLAFLRKSEDADRARVIVRMIIELAIQLSIIPLMEGVETEEQFQALVKMGCEYFQGFYFSRPVPVERFLEQLE